eukprot:15367089-Ditylum_brightwellii.AAC.2
MAKSMPYLSSAFAKTDLVSLYSMFVLCRSSPSNLFMHSIAISDPMRQPHTLRMACSVSTKIVKYWAIKLDGNKASFRSGDEGRAHISEGDLEQEEGRNSINDDNHNGKQEQQVSKNNEEQ